MLKWFVYRNEIEGGRGKVLVNGPKSLELTDACLPNMLNV